MRGFLPFEGHIHKANGLQSQHLTPTEREGAGGRASGEGRGLQVGGVEGQEGVDFPQQ